MGAPDRYDSALLTTVLVLSFAIPAAYGLGKSVADAEMLCLGHGTWGKTPLN